MKTRKTGQKLALNKQTIATLSSTELRNSKGGLPATYTEAGCAATEYAVCGSRNFCSLTCDTWELECRTGVFYCTLDSDCHSVTI
jgi:hypothetical protein